MKRNLILGNLILLASALLMGLRLKSQWNEFWSHNNLQTSIANKEPVPAGAKSGPQAAGVVNYGAIVENLLFTPDRNNVVVVDPAVAVADRPKPRPLLTGIVGLGAYEIALMLPAEAKDSSEYRRLKVGDSISGYTLVKCLDQKVLMSLDGKEVEIPISEPRHLVAREAPVTTGAGTAKSETVTTLGSATEAQNPSVTPPAVPPSGQVPGGTVKGKVLKSFPTPFGNMNLWVDEK